jgi:hypothetical protein
MPIHIDRMDTSIEISAPPATASTGGGERRATTTNDGTARDALRDVVGAVMAAELERFLRNRGL